MSVLGKLRSRRRAARDPGTISTARVAQSTPFRFYDNRQKYLAFVTTCNEKTLIAARCAEELAFLEPTPPALSLFDAGMGDGTVLSRVLRTVHHRFPTFPCSRSRRRSASRTYASVSRRCPIASSSTRTPCSSSRTSPTPTHRCSSRATPRGPRS